MESDQMMAIRVLFFVLNWLTPTVGNADSQGIPIKEDMTLATSSNSYRFKPAELADAYTRIGGNTYAQVIVVIDWKTGEPRGGRWRRFFDDPDDVRDDDVAIHLSAIDVAMDRGPDDDFIRSRFPTELPSWVPDFRQFEAKVETGWRPAERMYYTRYGKSWLAITCSKAKRGLMVCESNNQWHRNKWFKMEMQEKLLPQWREVFRASLEWVERHAEPKP